MAQQSTSSSTTQECDLCGCDRAYAWPRIPLRGRKDNSYFSFFDPKQLSNTNSSGCRACAFLKEGIERFETLDHIIRVLVDEGTDRDSSWICYRETDKAWVVSICWGKVDKSELILEFIDADFESPRFISAKHSNSPASLSWAKDQMFACRSNHQKCMRGSLHPDASTVTTTDSPSGPLYPALPTRVLDLGFSNSTIKIWVTPPSSLGEYACLSHCWGDHQPLRTLSNNLELFKENIPWDSFPKTFQDAIVFAKSLDFKYLWIDSLCIIQDNSSDWQREAGNMASVYRNSSLTLSATASPNCDHGLFYKYPEPRIHTLSVANTNGIRQEVFVRSRNPHWSDELIDGYKNNPLEHVQDYPLLHRAWAYQERLLSPRVLHFCKTELVWECMERSACQCGSFNPFEKAKKSIASSKKPKVETVVAEESSSLQVWAHIVEEYSGLDLTYASDRLPALAGLAEHMHLDHQGRYLVGLWEDSLARDLLWCCMGSTKETLQTARPSNSTLPTWSWASISDKPWFLPTKDFEQMCNIVQVKCTPVDNSNPRGNVLGW